MNTVTIEQAYAEGAGVKVFFCDKGEKIGEASTVEFDGKPNAFLHGFEVKKELRGKGYGTEILKYMIKEYDVSVLYVDEKNKAINLYRRFGFKAVGRFGDHMIIMKRTEV